MSRRSRHGVAGLFALLVASLGCDPPPELEQAQASLTAETNALHLLGVDRDGRLRHTIRNANGAWDRMGDVATQAGELGRITGTASAYNDGLLFVAARTGTSAGSFQWFLTTRFDNGQWASFAPMTGAALIADLGMDRTFSGRVHFCGLGPALFHGMWLSSTGFGGFSQVPVQRPAGTPAAVDCAVIGGELHYAVATHRNGGSGPIDVAIAVRQSDGIWSGFQQTHSLPASEGHAESLSLESSGDTLHLVVTTESTQYHAMKLSGGAWSGLGNVESVAGDPRTQFEWRVNSGAIAAVGGDLHLIQSAIGDISGKVWHTIRFPSGGWAQFQNVGSAVPAGLPNGGLLDVSLSRSRNN